MTERQRLGQEWLEHLRLAILLLLRESPGYALNESVITDVLRGPKFRFGCSRTAIRTELEWLKGMSLVRLEGLDHLTVATLIAEGDDVAQGLTVVAGVRKPSPR